MNIRALLDKSFLNRRLQRASACLLALACLLPAAADAQRPRDNGRLIAMGVTGGALYGGSLIVLSSYWYKNYPKSSFHFFNDNDEWQQMDKMGHFFTSYYEGYYGMRMLQWAGLPREKAIWYGGTWGLVMQTPIEILDGFSSGWGFSWGDELANTLGTALLISQEYAFKGQRFQPKFSFMPSEYAAMSPGLLGSNFGENLIKDYNGQNYWLSTPVNSLIPNMYTPTWFTISLGLGAKGMLRGTPEDQAKDPAANAYTRYRQFLLAFDVNLANIDAKNDIANAVLSALSWIKIPSPAIEYSKYRGFKAHLLYF